MHKSRSRRMQSLSIIMAVFASLIPLKVMVCGLGMCQCHKAGYSWEWGAPCVSDGVMEWQWPFHSQSYRSFTICSTLLFVLQPKAEEIPRSDLEQWLKFFYKTGKGFSQRLSNYDTPKETQLTSTDCTLPGFHTQGWTWVWAKLFDKITAPPKPLPHQSPALLPQPHHSHGDAGTTQEKSILLMCYILMFIVWLFV